MAKKKKTPLQIEQERAEYLLTVSALRYTPEVFPDVDPPEHGPETRDGYLPMGVTDPRISEACTSCVHHGYEHGKTSSQGTRSLYSTKLLALAALRNEVERDSAQKLRRIDKMIDREMGDALVQLSLRENPKISCGTCRRMRSVGEDDRCPRLLSCIVYAPSGKELRDWIPE